MNQQEAKKMEAEIDSLGWEYPGIVLRPGRYYDRMAFINLPPELVPKFGGDMMACIWRFDATPDEWMLTWRIRYNAGPNTDPFDKSENGDRKSWHVFRAKNGEVGRKEMVTLMEVLPLKGSAFFKIAPLEIDWLVIQGDVEKWIETVKREKKSWMHMREEKIK